MSKGQQIRVAIFGMEYTLKSEENPQYIVELAQFLDEQMKEVAKKSASSPPIRIAILAALNLADDLFRERHQREKLEERVNSLSAEYRSTLQAALAKAVAVGEKVAK
jgi:cell division protein ZapA